MFKNKRRIYNLALTSLGIMIIVYMGFLISMTSLGQNRIKELTFKEFDLKVQNSANILGYFCSDRKEDMNELATEFYVKSYFINKSSGLTKSFGLSNSVVRINEFFAKFLHVKSIQNKPIYDNLILIDDMQNVISSVYESKTFDALKLTQHQYPKATILTQKDNNNLHIFLAKSVYINQKFVGTLFAKVNLENVISSLTLYNEQLFMQTSLGIFSFAKKYFINSVFLSSTLIKKEINNSPFVVIGDYGNFIEGNFFVSKLFMYSLLLVGFFIIVGLCFLIFLYNKHHQLHDQYNLSQQEHEELALQISLRKESEKKLHENMDALHAQKVYNRAILDAQPNIVITTNGEYLQDANKAFFAFFTQYTLSDLIENKVKLCTYFLPFEQDENYLVKPYYDQKNWVEYAHTLGNDSAKILLLNEKKKACHFRVHVDKKVFDGQENIWVITLVDITKDVESTQTLKQLNLNLTTLVEQKTRALKRLNEELLIRIDDEVEKSRQKDRILYQQSKMASMGEMLGNIAHQWRQPLSSISSTASGIRIQKEAMLLSDESFYDAMDGIVSQSQHLSQTINDFRYFFKPDKEMECFDLKEAQCRTLKLLDSKLKQQNIEVIGDIPNVKVFGYESELIQVLMNILNNSCDAFESLKTTQRYIFMDASMNQDSVHIEIKDNAKGISPDIIERIFEPYFTTKHQSQGTGIGLYMTQEIITKHMHGSIDVKNISYSYNSTDFTGAQFILHFPLHLKKCV